MSAAARAARNAVRLATGIDAPRLGATSRDLVWRSGRCELWRYRSERVSTEPPLLLVFSLISRSSVLDLQPGSSFVEALLAAGFDVFLLDFAPADARHASERLEDHADLHLPEAIEQTRRAAGTEEVSLFGYCLGGVLALLHAAHHPESPLRSLTCMATPVRGSRWGLWAKLARAPALDVRSLLDRDGNVPARTVHGLFRLLQPTGELRRSTTLLERLADDDHVRAHRAMTAWTDDHVAFPGEELQQLLRALMHDELAEGRFHLAGDRIDLRDIRVPMLTVLARRDHIVPEAVAADLPDLVGSERSDVLRLDAGHVGLVVGRTAAQVTMPRIIEFLRRRSDAVAPRAA